MHTPEHTLYNPDDLDTPIDPFLSDDDNDEDELLDEVPGEVQDDREEFTDSVFTPVLVVDDLDAFLAESMATYQASKQGSHIRKELARAKSVEERKALQEKLRLWEDSYEWESLAHCVLMEHITCACGTTRQTFAGFFYHQKHRKDTHAQRWVRTEDSGKRFEPSFQKALAKKVLLSLKTIPLCATCMYKQGFDLLTAETLSTDKLETL